MNLFRFKNQLSIQRYLSAISLVVIILVVSCKGIAESEKESPIKTSKGGENQIFVNHKQVDADIFCKALSNKTFKIGDQFDSEFFMPGKKLTVSGGTPYVDFDLEEGSGNANYLSGSGDTYLKFRYTVVEGDYEDNVQPPKDFEKNGATIEFKAGKSTTDDISCSGGYSNVKIDGVRPYVIGILPLKTGSINTGEKIEIDLLFSESVNISGTPVADFQITIGAAAVTAVYSSKPSANRLRFTYTVNGGDLDSDGIELASSFNLNGATITDNAGNELTSLGLPSTDTSNITINVAELIITAQTTNDFGTLPIGGSSSLVFNITNQHSVENATSVTLSFAAEYSFTDINCGDLISGDTINADTTCSFQLDYTASADGNQGDTINLNYNNGYENTVLEYNVKAEGLGISAASASMITPATNLSNNKNPYISVTGLRESASVKIYLDSGCTTLHHTMGQTGLGGNIFGHTTNLPEGENDLYFTQTISEVESPCSSSLLTYTVDTIPPAAPSALTLSGGSSTSQSELVTWTASTDPNGISHYEYGIGTSPETDNIVTFLNIGDVVEYQDNTATYGPIDYYTSIRAVDNAGNVSAIAVSDAWSLDQTPPQPPTALAIVSDYFNGDLDTSINGFSWTPPETDLDHMKVAIGSTPGETDIVNWLTADTNSNHNFTSVGGITECVSIYPTVQSVDGVGNKSPQVNYTDGIKWDNTIPTDPTTLVVTDSEAFQDKSITVSWTAATDTCSPVSYLVSLSTTAGGNDINDWINIGTSTSYQMQDGVDGASFTLALGTNYYINIKAVDGAGNESAGSISSTPFKVKPPFAFLKGNQTTAPSSATNLAQATAYEMKWSSSSFTTGYFDHNPAINEHQLTIKTAGNYLLTLTFPISGTGARAGINTDVLLNGTPLDTTFSSSSYIRITGNHDNSSNHLSVVISNLVVDDIITIRTQRASTVTSNLTLDGDAALYMEYLDSNRSIFEATSDQLSGGGTNLNVASPTKFDFNHSITSGDFSHNNSTNPENISINSTAHYLVTMNIPTQTTCGSTRHSIKVKILKNGSEITGATAAQGYTRCSNDYNHATLHFSAVLSLSATDVISVTTERNTSQTGTISLYSGTKASLFMEKLDSEKFISLSGTETTTSTDWNAVTSADIKWSNEYFKDSTLFTHSTSSNNHQITVLSDGDYMIVYNDALTSAIQRANVAISVKVNGINISHAACKSHYIRNLDSHTESSCSIHTFLENLNANDIITIEAGQEAAAGVVNILGEAKLAIIKK